MSIPAKIRRMSGPILAAILGEKNPSRKFHNLYTRMPLRKRKEGNAFLKDNHSPVCRGAEGDALGTDAQGEALAEVDPGRGSPEDAEGHDVQDGEGDEHVPAELVLGRQLRLGDQVRAHGDVEVAHEPRDEGACLWEMCELGCS